MGTQELQAWGSGHGIVITGHKACRLGRGGHTGQAPQDQITGIGHGGCEVQVPPGPGGFGHEVVSLSVMVGSSWAGGWTAFRRGLPCPRAFSSQPG